MVNGYYLSHGLFQRNRIFLFLFPVKHHPDGLDVLQIVLVDAVDQISVLIQRQYKLHCLHRQGMIFRQPVGIFHPGTDIGKGKKFGEISIRLFPLGQVFLLALHQSISRNAVVVVSFRSGMEVGPLAVGQ